MGEVYVTPDELAERFGVRRRRLLELNAKHGWPHVRIGKHIRWTEDQIDQILRKHTVTGGVVNTKGGRTARSTARRGARA